MIDSCLDLMRNELNARIKDRTGVREEKVVLTNLGRQIDLDEAHLANKTVMSVVDIVQEEQGSTDEEYVPQGDGSYITQSQPIKFNVYILFSAYYKLDHVLEGFKYLSLVIAFFQSKNYFDVSNTSPLQQLGLDNLSMELVNLSYQEKSALWKRISTPYVPSVLYKLGIIPVEDTEARGIRVPEIKDIVIH